MSEEKRSAPNDGKEALRTWAREWARRLPPWSDEQWCRINAGLGYQVTPRHPGSAIDDGMTPLESDNGQTSA